MTPDQVTNFWAKVDKTGECWEWTASRRANGYGQVMIRPRNRSAHRVAWELTRGDIPAGLLIDHICRNKGCVNPDHLRLATQKQNGENRHMENPRSASGLRGVIWDKSKGKWQARVGHNSRHIYLGYFATAEAAALVASDARRALFTHSEIDKGSNPS